LGGCFQGFYLGSFLEKVPYLNSCLAIWPLLVSLSLRGWQSGWVDGEVVQILEQNHYMETKLKPGNLQQKQVKIFFCDTVWAIFSTS
jgi:hypothetical protein